MASRIHIHLRTGHIYETDVPDGFNFTIQMAAIKASGHYLDQTVFIPVGSIDFAYMSIGEAVPTFIHPIVSGMTRQ